MSTNKVYPSKEVMNETQFLCKGESLHAESQHNDDTRGSIPTTDEDSVMCDKDNNGVSTNSNDGNIIILLEEEDFEILNIIPIRTNILDKATDIIENNAVEEDIDYVHTEKTVIM